MKKNFNIFLQGFLILSFSMTVSFSYSQAIINKYAAVLSYQGCDNTLTVDSTTGFNIGDTVLMIQMKGAVIDTTNTSNFGNVLSYNGCGNYEYNVVKAINGNNISLVYNIVRDYDISFGKVQLVSVPSYQNYTVAQPHTCMAWNGAKGGVFAISIANTLTLNNNIDVTGMGFKGGQILLSTQYSCNNIDYYYPSTNNFGAQKGEGIAEISIAKMYGKGALANAGGGGNDHNSGGGGGGNAGSGGIGGNQYQLSTCSSYIADLGGRGGKALSYSSTQNKIFLGGGGGAGHGNDFGEKPGAQGGGIILINTNSIVINSGSISSNGANAIECSSAVPGCQNDGTGGGGGGGTIYLKANNFTGSLNVNAKGGKGANVWMGPTTPVGPGGGGSGGAIIYTQATIPAATTNAVTQGNNGILPQFANTNWGAQPGNPGQVLTNFNLVYPTDTFINSGLIADFDFNRTSCYTFQFNDQSAFTMGASIIYNWNFGDGSTLSTQQDPSHSFPAYGSYVVTLTITTSDGCTDVISKTINIPNIDFLSTSNDTTICSAATIQMQASGAVSYQWSPATGLSDAFIANPIAAVANSITYTVTGLDTNGCTDIDSVRIIYQPYRDVIVTPEDPKICSSGSVQLNVSGINDPIWTPATGLDNENITNPIASPTQTTTYFVTGKSNSGCDGKDTVTVFVYQNPEVKIIADHDTINCAEPFISLTATGAVTYTWSPADLLNNSLNQNVIAKTLEPTEFFVQGIDSNGCQSIDSIFIYVTDNVLLFVPNAFSPNGDGLNEEFLPKYNCDLDYIVFSVYNRFGQRVFSTGNKFIGWTGLQNGKDADVGTYFWIITGKDNSGKVVRKGNVTLIR